MCVACGCGSDGTVQMHRAQDPARAVLDFGAGQAGVSVPGLSQERAIRIEADVLGANNHLASLNRAHFDSHGIVAYNLVSSPGSGKTALLCATLRALSARMPELGLGVIEGDQQTSHDADRIRATGVAAVQVNTGKGCHLDAQMVAEAFAALPLHGHAHDHSGHHAHGHDHGRAPSPQTMLLIENVGNLVCPAMWDLGERAKVAVLSVTEGEDKPLKYPDMFAAADIMVINKIDLLPHVDFDVQQCIDYARRVNPGIEVRQVSARSGEGLPEWLDWLLRPWQLPARAGAREAAGDTDELQRLRARVAELEARLASHRD